MEIVTAVNYQVTQRYACSQADAGSTIELEFLGHRLSGLIEPANEVPLRGAENDRVPRIESCIKDFAPLELGMIELPVGRAALTLRALHLAGTQVMELESVELRLMP